jgi:hypothetical protein
VALESARWVSWLLSSALCRRILHSLCGFLHQQKIQFYDKQMCNKGALSTEIECTIQQEIHVYLKKGTHDNISVCIHR